MNLSALTSNAAWTVRNHWRQGRWPVFARPGLKKGWTVRTWHELNHEAYHILALDGWEMVEQELPLDNPGQEEQ